MEYVFSFDELYGYSNVRELKEMEDLEIVYIPSSEKSIVDDIDYYRAILVEEDKRFNKFKDEELTDYLRDLIIKMLEKEIRTYGWDNYKYGFYFEDEEVDEYDVVCLIKAGKYYLNFDFDITYVYQKNKLKITGKTIDEVFKELNMTEDDICEIGVLQSQKDRISDLRHSLKLNNARRTSKRKIKEYVENRLYFAVPNLNESNDAFFQDFYQDELDNYILKNASIEDINEFIYKNKQ